MFKNISEAAKLTKRKSAKVFNIKPRPERMEKNS